MAVTEYGRDMYGVGIAEEYDRLAPTLRLFAALEIEPGNEREQLEWVKREAAARLAGMSE